MGITKGFKRLFGESWHIFSSSLATGGGFLRARERAKMAGTPRRFWRADLHRRGLSARGAASSRFVAHSARSRGDFVRPSSTFGAVTQDLGKISEIAMVEGQSSNLRRGPRPTASSRAHRQHPRVAVAPPGPPVSPPPLPVPLLPPPVTPATPTLSTPLPVPPLPVTTAVATSLEEAPGAPGSSFSAAEYEDLLVNLSEDDEELMTRGDEETRPRRNRACDVDITGLSTEDAQKRVADFKKKRAREARKRYKEKRKAGSEDAALEAREYWNLRPFNDVQLHTTDGVSSYIQEGDAYQTKAALHYRICELAESLCLTLILPRNTKYELIATSEDFHGTQPRPLFVHGSFRLSSNTWKVRKVVLSGAMGMGPQVIDGKMEPNWRKNQACTAYSEDMLAWHAKDAVRAQPSLSRACFVALFAETLRFPEHVPGDVWSRVRRKAYYLSFGIPDENVARLPALKAEMEKRGHNLEFATIDGKEMVACVLSVRRAECDRRRKAALKVPVEVRTDMHRQDLLPWSQQRAEFESSHGDFLRGISHPDSKYLSYLAFSFGFVQQQFVTLLKFISTDACFGKFHLDAFQIFSVCGVTSNGNVVALGNVLIAGNESEETWTRAWSFFSRTFPSINKDITIVSDGDKGIPNALQNVFGSEKPFDLRCSKHRAENIRLRFGKAAQTEFWRCVKAKLPAQIARVKASPTYLALSEAARAALSSLPDERQFPAAASARGAKLYGRDSNQLSETDNSAILPSRSLDPLRFVLWHCDRAVRLYSKFHHESRACDSFVTPYALQRLRDTKKTGVVHPIVAEHTTQHQAFNVVAGENVYKVILRIPLVNDTNPSRFPIGKVPCTCGVPGMQHMPCGHMLAVAQKISLNYLYMMPVEFTTAAWTAQYPDADVFVPTMADVQASTVPRDESLRNPVAAPPKRGRPAKRRMRGVMERIVKRARVNAGR